MVNAQVHMYGKATDPNSSVAKIRAPLHRPASKVFLLGSSSSGEMCSRKRHISERKVRICMWVFFAMSFRLSVRLSVCVCRKVSPVPV